jgi:pimeloyl-ACP methyl ester carboxylesterase
MGRRKRAGRLRRLVEWARPPLAAVDPVKDRHLRLPDGRGLGYRIYGDPKGAAVLFLHGTPGSRLKFSIAHEAGRSLGLAIIAPDRWGYGLTEAPAKPSLSRFAEDMAALMNALGHKRFTVGGISGGGPYAAAVAACLPKRVAALALVSPVGPIADAGLGPSLPLLHRLCFTVLPRRPRTVSTAMRAFRWSLTHTPRLAGHLTTWRAARPDKRLIRRPEVGPRILGSFKEGLRPGTAGPNIDLAIFSRPWKVDLACIEAPTRLWIGAKDSNVPLSAVRALARRIPHCEVTELPDAGHLWVSVHHAEVLAWLGSVTPRGGPKGTQGAARAR